MQTQASGEAKSLISDAFPGMKQEANGAASGFGFRIDEVGEKSYDGQKLKQGHQGTHINYYDKQNKTYGSIIIEE